MYQHIEVLQSYASISWLVGESEVGHWCQKVKHAFKRILVISLPVFLSPNILHPASWSSSCSHTDRMWGALIVSPPSTEPDNSSVCVKIKWFSIFPRQGLTERVVYLPKMRETFRYHCQWQAVDYWLINAALERALETINTEYPARADLLLPWTKSNKFSC